MRFGGIFLATAVLLLSACSGEPEPKEPTTTPKPVPTSTATLPAMPDQAKEGSPEGAAAFVTHWVNVLNYAAATGETEELHTLSLAECTSCSDYIELFKQTYESGGYFRGGAWTLTDVEVEIVGDRSDVYAHITAPVGEQRDPASGEVGETAAEDQELVFRVEGDPKRMVEIERSDP